MTFALPPLTLPSDIIAAQNTIQKGTGVDKDFLNSMLSVSNGTGLFTNPFADHISSLTAIQGQFTSLSSAADAVGAGASLSTITGHITDMTTIFNNMATNIVPVNLPMSSTLASGVTSAASSLPGISANDAPCLGTFLTSTGVPQVGQVMQLSTSQYVLNTQCGTVDPTNPMPMLTQFSGMLTSMTEGATAFVNMLQSSVTSLASTASSELAGAFGSAVTSVESQLQSSFSLPIASFGANMFSTIKNQMTAGLGISIRHMTETNFASKYIALGEGSVVTSYKGIMGSGVGNIFSQFPSITNTGITANTGSITLPTSLPTIAVPSLPAFVPTKFSI